MNGLVDWKAAAGMLAGAFIAALVVTFSLGWNGPPFGGQMTILIAAMLVGAWLAKRTWKEPHMSTPPPLSQPSTRRFIEQRKRGFFGYMFAFVFWAWNIFMAWATLAGLANVGQLGTTLTSDAERVGHAAGATIGFSLMLMLWAAGAVIFGLLMYATRGRQEMIEVQG